MRKVLFTFIFLILLVVGIAAVWIFQGPKITLCVDRYGITETASEPITSVRYEGDGTGGVLHINQVLLSLNSSVPPLQPPSIGSTKDGKLGLATGGKVFPLGELKGAGDESDQLATVPDNGDDARIVLGHSKVSWPTPLEMNFATGASPSWKRHTYQRLSWTKSNGAKLEMLWRYEQHFLGANGWTSPGMTRENQTGLVKVDISP